MLPLLALLACTDGCIASDNVYPEFHGSRLQQRVLVQAATVHLHKRLMATLYVKEFALAR